ncbi:hypothetical protein OIU84_016704 [Salix udensis]|uniref:Uncharacterized protein n=1 Tax=Salix udensis TaxID=889485 RepID=A0AAD6JBW6_9ROSI|nr:hypothetical protein OIU84_016704 [Salix udensis]
MAKGRGMLSIDSDPISTTSASFLHNLTVLNSFPDQDSIINPRLKQLSVSAAAGRAMDATSTGSPPSTIQFPVKLMNTNGVGDDGGGDDHGSSFPPDYRRRPVIDEMDFFAHKKHDDGNPMTITNSSADDLKEYSGSPVGLELNVNYSSLSTTFFHVQTQHRFTDS